MNETTVHGHILRGFEAKGYWAFKIPDAAKGIQKPCDIVACFKGVHVSIEAKISKVEVMSEDSVVLTKVSFKGRQHQLDHCVSICQDGGLGLIAAALYQEVSPYKKRCWLVRADYVMNGVVYTVADMRRIGMEMSWAAGVKPGWYPEFSPRVLIRRDDLKEYVPLSLR